ncbi:MAG: cytochrome c3 family protein [Gallionella sp.]|nr:cytochrome c3 family protein [Gallionella sp.]
MSRTLKLILAANLIAIAILAFVYPNLMVGPGKLIPGHKQLETDCFACHAPLLGAASERCVSCHKPAEIGRLTTAGKPIAKPLTSAPFHQKLINQDCLACHNDHAGVKRFRQQGRFNHALLQKTMLDQCQSCHKPPVNLRHQRITGNCSQCHNQNKWTPATFDHALLPKAGLDQCQSCHKAPGDSLHRQIAGNCGQCHNQNKWTPAAFDHNKYFWLDRDHNASCVTCHMGNDYSRYTCYGCHEHSVDKIRREHIEEGIRDFDNCVECHRSGNKHDIKGGDGEGRGNREGRRDRKGRDDDD